MSAGHAVLVLLLGALAVALAAFGVIILHAALRRPERRGGLLELDHPAARNALLSWSCMVCGRWRADDQIAVASVALEWGQINVRYCADSHACRVKAEERAAADAARFDRSLGL